MSVPTVSLVLYCLQLMRTSFIVALAVCERTRKVGVLRVRSPHESGKVVELLSCASFSAAVISSLSDVAATKVYVAVPSDYKDLFRV